MVLRVEGVGLMERDDLNAEDVLSWGQIGGDGDAILYKAVQSKRPPIRTTAKVYLSSVTYQPFDSPGAGVTFMEDLDPGVTITIGACRREVCDFGFR
jgi:hypothetical protein